MTEYYLFSRLDRLARERIQKHQQQEARKKEEQLATCLTDIENDMERLITELSQLKLRYKDAISGIVAYEH